VTVVLLAGIVKVVLAAVGFATVAPDQSWNTSPAGGVLARMETTAPAV
jgi:hypothetical protein